MAGIILRSTLIFVMSLIIFKLLINRKQIGYNLKEISILYHISEKIFLIFSLYQYCKFIEFLILYNTILIFGVTKKS